MTTFRIPTNLSGLTDDWSDIRKRCAAAARLALRSPDLYSDEDRADCAAHLLSDVMEKVGAHAIPDAAPTGRTATFDPSRETRRTYVLRLLRYIDAAERGNVPTRTSERMVPTALVSMSRLAGVAANYRRSVLRDRERDATVMEMRGDAWTVPSAETVALDRERVFGPDTPVTPILRHLPMAGRVPAVATAVYGALREMDGAVLAHDLDVKPAALRKMTSRGMATLRTLGSAEDYRAALGCAVHSRLTRDDIGPARSYAPRSRTSRSRSLAHSERVTGGETVKRSDGRGSRAVKLYPAHLAPISERKTSTVKMWTATGGKRSAWADRMTPGRAAVMTRARLAQAARISRERTYTAPMADRSSRRLSAGITRPPMVPTAIRSRTLTPRES